MKCNIREEQREDCREMDSIMRIPSAVLLCAVKCFGLGFSLSGVRREISRSLPPAYYMCNNVNYSHCYRFLMYFSNFIFYVQVIFSDIFLWRSPLHDDDDDDDDFFYMTLISLLRPPSQPTLFTQICLSLIGSVAFPSYIFLLIS